MALSVSLLKTISPSRRLGLNTTPLYSGPLGASQSFKKGAPLIYTSGYLVVAASAPIDTDDNIVGFAAEDATSGSAGVYTMHYVPAIPGVIFEGTLEDATNFDHALVATNLGLSYVIDTDTSSKAWFLDENTTTKGIAKIIELVDPIGTVRGKARFVVAAR